MNTRHSFRWLWLALVVVCLTVPFFANKAATQPQGASASASVKTAGGLTVVTFIVDPGTIKLNLPDDMTAGDTISGTVVAEPKGNTKEERAANRSELNKMGIKLFSRGEDKPEDVICGDVVTVFKYTVVNDRQSGNVLSVRLQVVNPGKTISEVSIPVLPQTPSGAVITPDPTITVPTHPSGAVITPDPKITPPGTTPKGAVITPDPKITPLFSFPPLGQTGRPIVVTGSFDGDSSNTILNWTVVRSAVQDVGKNTENVSGGFGLIAESPRKAVFTAPNNVIGPIELHLTEASTQSTGGYRNVGVNLSAPKTSLLKGEKTELRVEVSGLQGITAPVPLTLESRGVITMEGGTYEPLVIQPSQVDADGRYSTTRGITGVQTGGWGATATVVTNRFDVCLQDDTAPARRVLWNTFNGDYIFTCPGCSPPAGQAGGSSGQPTDQTTTGKGTITTKGCICTLEHNERDRRVMSRINQCTHTGSASVQTVSPKVKFTITDRNTTDNTCAVQ